MELATLTPSQVHLLQELLDNELQFQVTKDGFVLDGFYKSGTVTLIPQEQGENKPAFVTLARYDEHQDVDDLQDLVALNYFWFLRSRERLADWKVPDEAWVPLLIKFEYVKMEKEEVVKYHTLK